MSGNEKSNFIYQQSRQARSQWQLIKPVQVEFHLKVPHLEDTNRMSKTQDVFFLPIHCRPDYRPEAEDYQEVEEQRQPL